MVGYLSPYILIYFDLLAVYGTKHTLVWVFGSPLLYLQRIYNGGLRILGCSPGGEALASPLSYCIEPLILIVIRMRIYFQRLHIVCLFHGVHISMAVDS